MLLALAAFALASANTSACAVTLVHTNDVLGDLEPCGCRTNPQGGMARKANLLKRLEDQQIIQLDAGDLLFATTNLPPILQKQAELQAGYLLKSMEQTHHDAVVPGEKDFAQGVKVFDQLRKKSPIKFLAANLVRKNGSKYLEKEAIFTRKGKDGKNVRVAVFGLVGEDLGWPKELKATPAIAAAKKEVAALRKKADFVIALTHEGFEKDQELAKAVPGIDVIVGGHTQSFLQQPPRVNGALIVQSSFRNQYIGVLPLEHPISDEKYKLVGLDAGYDSPADAPSPMDKLVKEFKTAVGDLNTKEEAAMMAETAAASKAEGPATPKFQTFPRCAECHYKQFDFWRKTQHAEALIPLIEKDQYKNMECLSCHTVGLGDKEGFSTVSHLAELKKPDAEGELQTTPWETQDLAKYLTAMREAKNLQDEIKVTQGSETKTMPLKRSLSAISRSWTPVQCENCHMPGRDHPFSGNYVKTVEKNVCLQCHTHDRAPEWYTQAGQPDWEKINAKRKSITCPAGEISESE